MKILQVVHGFPPENNSGTELHTFELAKELSKDNDVYIFCRTALPSLEENTVLRRKHERLTVFSINNTFRNCGSFEATYNNPKIGEVFRRVLEEVNPDIVHIQHLMYLGVNLIHEIKNKGIPIVFTLHDYWLLCPQGQLLMNNRIPCEGNSLNDCPECVLYQLSLQRNVPSVYLLVKRYMPEFIFLLVKNIYLQTSRLFFLNNRRSKELLSDRREYLKAACESVDKFIAPSESIKNKFSSSGFPKDKIMVVRHGLRIEYFKDIAKSVSSRVRFGYIGNLMPSKGVHILIESFNRINKNGIAELKIFGKSLSYKGALGNYNATLKRLAGSNVKFSGSFANDKIGGVLKDIDVLVVPSLWAENSPLVILEAIITRTPIIASGIGGIPELIEDGANGMLFEPGNIQELAQKMEFIVKHPDFIHKPVYSTAGVKSIKENSNEIMGIYKSIQN